MATEGDNPTITWASERHLRVAFAGPDAADRTARAYAGLRGAHLPGVLDLTPAYATLLVHVDLHVAGPTVESAVRATLREDRPAAVTPDARTFDIPVCYGGAFGPDLADVARLHGLTEDQVIHLHVGPAYTVRFLGFSPGFPYLAGLPDRLATPRLEAPRPAVPAGSIAITGDQAGIYPRPTAGGWRLLGRTPLALFDPARTDPVLLRPGDRVRFRPIPPEHFEGLSPGAAG